VLVHHVLAHLLSVGADEGQTGGPIRKRVLDAAPHDAIHLLLDVFRQRAIDDDAAERNRGARFGFPVLAEIDDLLEALRGVGETVLMNDQPGVERPVEHRTFDGGEEQL